MTSGAISFRLNGEERSLSNVSPTLTLLEYLREREGLTGTKEGCAEGDCGACTVMVSSRDKAGQVRREAINACIRFMPSLHGASVTTVEALSTSAEDAHPVQRVMVDAHGSQCGFCTPGIIMSLYTAYRNRSGLDRAQANDTLAGNLCRCTGYGPILAAAEALDQAAKADDQAGLGVIDDETVPQDDEDNLIALRHGDERAFLPANADQLAEVYAAHPDAILVAGATDVGLWVTKQHRQLGATIFMQRVRDLDDITVDDGSMTIGACVSYTRAHAALAERFPDFGELIRRIGAVQVRNAGTIGGNIANGSPIGDTPPALIALGAKLRLRKGGTRRELALEDFYIEYGKQDRAPGEFVEAIVIPLAEKGDALRCYKISKRFDQDISALCGAFNIELSQGKVSAARIAFGGVAGVPKRARAVEAALIGRAWSEAEVRKAMMSFEEDFQPISDMRASADYRLNVSKNLLLKYFYERQDGLEDTRLVGLGSQFS